MRQCDDISDNAGTVETKREQFQQWQETFLQAMNDDDTQHPTLLALRDTVNQFRIPLDYFLQLIQGTEMDLTTNRYSTFEELYRYCYHVASVVGLICIQVFEYEKERAKECAKACGIAFQLTNILRDIREDLDRDRVYLPLKDLERFHYSENDLRNNVTDKRFHDLVHFQIVRARAYYAEAAPLAEMICEDSRAAFLVMYRSYLSLLQHIEDKGSKILDERVHLSKAEKLKILLQAFWKR